MKKVLTLLVVIGLLAAQLPVYAQSSMGADYLCELGIAFFDKGDYTTALHEFNKALLADPGNETAAAYIAEIKRIRSGTAPVIAEPVTAPEPQRTYVAVDQSTYSAYQQRDAEMEALLNRLESMPEAVQSSRVSGYEPAYEQRAPATRRQGSTVTAGIPVKFSGDLLLSAGFNRNDAIWRKANFDLNERNYRLMSSAAYNNRLNTFDPYIFQRLNVNMDAGEKTGVRFHSNVSVDPWSYTAKSQRMTLTGADGDSAEVEVKYWGGTRYTVPETIYTRSNGDSFNIPEIKVKDGRIDTTSITSTWGNVFTIPETKLHDTFQPVRELWLERLGDGFDWKIFPLGLQDQALSSTDPLGLSNHHSWWQASPWIRRWKPGNHNTGTLNADFTKGYWDDSLASIAKDSDATFLTQLIGGSMKLYSDDLSSLQWTVATPKDPWQDYGEVDNVISAARGTYRLLENLEVGSTYTTRVGFNTDNENKTDARSNTIGVDTSFEPVEGMLATAQAAHSQADYDMSSPEFRSEKRGGAYYVSVIGRYPKEPLLGRDNGYNGIKPQKGEEFMAKFRFYGAHLDSNFDAPLSDYNQTRKDAFWSRHLHFRKPFAYYYGGLFTPGTSWESIEPFRIGDGISAGRDTLGFRLETTWVDRFNNLFDARNVHRVNGKYLESVLRDEVEWRMTDRLTSKFLAIYQHMPRTVAGIDPFLYDAATGENIKDWSTDPVDDGKNACLHTYSGGLSYDLSEWASVHGIWEHTNDYTLAYDNFPRGVFNSSEPSLTYYSNGDYFRGNNPFVYDQQLFPQAPYAFYDIFRAGLNLTPMEDLEIYIDYTRNEFESAGPIDSNMNHIGFEAFYMLWKKFGIATKYTYSRWKDPQSLKDGRTHAIGHHNLFTELRYLPSKDEEFAVLYGVGGSQGIALQSYDPFGGSLATIDTEHLIRLYYKRKF